LADISELPPEAKVDLPIANENGGKPA